MKARDVIIIDDMISSGESMIDVASELKKRGASRVFCATTFGLFTNGFKKFDEAYENGIIDRILQLTLCTSQQSFSLSLGTSMLI